MTNCFRVSVPGSLMLMGEHAVLWGTDCLVMAVDQALTVTLKSHDEKFIRIKSDFGDIDLNPEDIPLTPPFTGPHRFILSTLSYYYRSIKQGFELTIHSTLQNGKGFGSSAAVVVGVQAVLLRLYQRQISIQEKIMQGRVIVQHVQGYGSGADIAASLIGGIVLYQQNLTGLRKIKQILPLTAIFCGYKTPTADVIYAVEQRRQQDQQTFTELQDTAQQLVLTACEAIHEQDFIKLGTLFKAYQTVMQKFGVEDENTRLALEFLDQQPDIFGSKISGSGMGDCVIGVGTLNPDCRLLPDLQHKKMEIIPIQTRLQGLYNESL